MLEFKVSVPFVIDNECDLFSPPMNTKTMRNSNTVYLNLKLRRLMHTQVELQ